MKILKDNHHVKACIFDLDGTLLDSMSLWQEVDRKYLARYGIVFDPIYSEEIKKMSFDESAKYFIEKFKIPRSEKQIKEDWNQMVEAEYRDNIMAKPGGLEIIQSLAKNNIALCVATSCNKEHAKMALQRLGMLPYFDFILTCAEVGKNKEYPDVFHACANRLEVAPHECLVFEDLYMALKVCHKEGFLTVGIYDELSAHEKQNAQKVCNYYINDFFEIM